MASSGTPMERNTSSSRISESPTTIARYGGRASPSLVETSTLPAVWPVRPMLTPVVSLIWPFSARSSETTWTVLALAGPSFGMTWNTAVRRSSLSATGTAAATLSSPAEDVRDVELLGLGFGFGQAGGEVAHHHDRAGHAFAEAAAVTS